jgi:hypothetical protein
MGPSEHQSFRLRCTVIHAPWVSWWWCPVHHEISKHITLDRMARDKVWLELNQLYNQLSDVTSRVGVVEHNSQQV